MKTVKIKTTYKLDRMYIGKLLVEFDENGEAEVQADKVKGIVSKYFHVVSDNAKNVGQEAQKAPTRDKVEKVEADKADDAKADGDAKNVASDEVKKDAPQKTRAELKAEAEALGLTVKSRDRVADIEAMIAEAGE